MKINVSYYAISHEGVMDFGKFAQEKIKSKKEPSDLESKQFQLIISFWIEVPILTYVIED